MKPALMPVSSTGPTLVATEEEETAMTKRALKVTAAGAAAGALALGGAALARATGGSDDPEQTASSPSAATAADEAKADDGDVSVHGSGAERATEAALRLSGGVHANAVERDSEDGATWEVEVAMRDGSTVDVRLDESFRLVVIEPDSGS
jgi:uncharacterized membrane protein YkoI